MGGAAPSRSLVDHLMPLYYIKDAVISPDEAILARASWSHIANDTSPAFIEAKGSEPPLEYCSCLTWTYELFYGRLFDVHPSARPLFKNSIQVQGKALVNLIGLALGSLDDIPGLTKVLTAMAKVHSEKGVMAYQYGIVGECLIWTLTRVLGPAFDDKTKIAWVKIYSIMLSIIIPVAVKEERSMRLH